MFGKLFGKGKDPGTTGRIAPLPPAIRDAIFDNIGARSVQTMPSSAQRAFQLSIDPKAEARQFVEIVEADEGLSARVLKIANSVFFDRGSKSNTIEQAVVVIGINELRNLLNATCLSEIFPSRSPLRSILWSHDIAVALAARELAKILRPRDVELAFLGGLMHDVGKLLLIQRAADRYAQVVRSVEGTGMEFCEAETQVFPFNHCEVGQLIGERWNFSDDLLRIIKEHHSAVYPHSTSQADDLAFIIGLADAISHAQGLGIPARWSKFRTNKQEQLQVIWEKARIDRNQHAAIMENIAKTFEREYDLYARSG